MRDVMAICDPSELAFAQGATGPLILCLGETSSFNASAIMAAQNARLGRRNAGQPRGEPGKRASQCCASGLSGLVTSVACVGHARGHAVEDTASLTGRKFVAEKH